MKRITNILLMITAVFVFQNCIHEDAAFYEGGNALFFERYKRISNTQRERIDTVLYSFSHYVGVTDITHYFRIGLIGDTLSQDKEYSVVVVDSLTTATPDQYTLPEGPLFHKGSPVDSLPVTIHQVPSLKDKEVVLTLRLVDNAYFGLGYNDYRDVRIRFNDKISQPKWWDRDVELAYLGDYSYEKYATIFAANPGFTTFDGLSATEKRKVALNTKNYIAEKGIVEADGSPMIIPMY